MSRTEAIYFITKWKFHLQQLGLSNFHLHANVGRQNRKGTKQGQPIDNVPKGLKDEAERNKQVSKQVGLS